MTKTPQSRSKLRRSIAALASAAAVAALSLRSFTAMNNFSDEREDGVDGPRLEELEGADELRRFLAGVLDDEDYSVEDDYDAAFALANPEGGDVEAMEAASRAADSQPLQPYSIEDTLVEATVFEYTFCILVYDPPKDHFVVLYSKDHKWKAGNKKLFKAVLQFSYMLRRLFPDRFTPESPELALAIGSGDYPHVRKSMLPHVDGKAPVLMFGSAFRNVGLYPNMMAMPMPEARHLSCFVNWLVREGEGTQRVCTELRPKAQGGEMEAYEDVQGLEWDNLIPQVIWRGTDFGYLPSLQSRPSLVHPDSRRFVRSPNVKAEGDRRADAVRALNEEYDTLLPRWKGVALTAVAELQAQDTGSLPWIDIRFSAYLYQGKSPTVGSPKYSAWESVGIGTGKGMSLEDLAKYKYHIDLGGGGGTTWSGTIEKLAMPGLLFHHVTATKDYFHDRMRPWRHYVPVGPDLKDLKAKFEWAESHPEKAKRIADAGTDFVRHLGTLEGFGEMFQEDFVEPLRRVIEAYQPVGSRDLTSSSTWQTVLLSMGRDDRVMPVMECKGLSPDSGCSLVGGDAVMKFQKSGIYSD